MKPNHSNLVRRLALLTATAFCVLLPTSLAMASDPPTYTSPWVLVERTCSSYAFSAGTPYCGGEGFVRFCSDELFHTAFQTTAILDWVDCTGHGGPPDLEIPPR